MKVSQEIQNAVEWNTETDIIDTNSKPLIKIESELYKKWLPWAYAINTARGIFGKKSEDSEYNNSIKVDLTNEEMIKVSLPVFPKESLVLETEEESVIILDNMMVFAQKFYKDFMIVKDLETQKIFLIDRRGVFFDISSLLKVDKYETCLQIRLNRRNGTYDFQNGLSLRFRSDEREKEFTEKTKANSHIIFNKEFNKFVKANSRNEEKYLYLTGGQSKCGAIIDAAIQNKMQYEVVPNMFCDDDTINIRIPLNEYNNRIMDAQFLASKYRSTYSIYNIPFSVIGGGLELPINKINIVFENDFHIVKSKECAVYSIINSLRLLWNTENDYEIYKKSISKVCRMLKHNGYCNAPNHFDEFLLLHPYENISSNYIEQKKCYINELLLENGESEMTSFDSVLYDKAYQFSKNKYKLEMATYESRVVERIIKQGKKVTKWVNESTLFEIVRKEYPDAIYQYRSDWLGKQSLDIFIPSENIGIEYQGEQHYRPIEYFGGEEGFENTLQRDIKKKKLCESNNVKLIEWKYDEIVSRAAVKKRIEVL